MNPMDPLFFHLKTSQNHQVSKFILQPPVTSSTYLASTQQLCELIHQPGGVSNRPSAAPNDPSHGGPRLSIDPQALQKSSMT